MTDLKPTLFERSLAVVAPAIAARRVAARLGFERLFEAASQDRRLGPRRLSAGSINSDIVAAGGRIRFRARDLENNNRLVRSMIERFAAKVVGTGITPRALHADETLRQQAQDAWDRFADTCDVEGQQDYYGLQAMAAKAMFRDGEAFRIWSNGNANVHLIEADQVDETLDAAGADSQTRQGIAFTSTGARRGYYILPHHPGDQNLMTRRSAQAQLVAASDVDHIFQPLRPGQIRGVSWLASVIVTLSGVDDVIEASIWRKRVEACIALILQTPDMQGSNPNLGKQEAVGGRVEETLAPGLIWRSRPGETATALTPSSSGDTVDFIRSMLYSVLAACGLSYHEVTGDVSQANYSSLRAATLAGYQIVDAVQWHILAPAERRAWRRVMNAEAMRSGKKALRDVPCGLAMPTRPWVDPVKEVTAKIAEIRAGLESMPNALGERGLNADVHLAEIAKFMAISDQLGLVFDTDARRVNGSGALQNMASQPDSANP